MNMFRIYDDHETIDSPSHYESLTCLAQHCTYIFASHTRRGILSIFVNPVYKTPTPQLCQEYAVDVKTIGIPLVRTSRRVSPVDHVRFV